MKCLPYKHKDLVPRRHLKGHVRCYTVLDDNNRHISEVLWSALTDYLVTFMPMKEPVSEIKVEK